MEKYCLYVMLSVFICSFSACKNVEHGDATQADSLVEINQSLKDSSAIQAQTDEEEYDQSELDFVVCAAEGYNYDSLKNIALKIADRLKFKVDSFGRYYNPMKKSIVVPEDDADEMYAGQYFLRRSADNVVSVEMRYAYVDTSLAGNFDAADNLRSDTTKMFVFVTMYTAKSSADSLLKIIKKDWPAGKIIATEIYMGCMH